MSNKKLKIFVAALTFLILFINLSSAYEFNSSIIQDPHNSANYIALAADAGGAILPGVTGLGIAVRTAKGADKALDAVQTADKIADGVDGVRALEKEKERVAQTSGETAGQTTQGLKSFTQGNFRENVGTITGSPLAKGTEQAHHVFPQANEFSTRFNDAGINIHDPSYGARVETKAHQSFSKEYNKDWREFFSQPGFISTKDKILNKGKELANKYKYKFKTNYKVK